MTAPPPLRVILPFDNAIPPPFRGILPFDYASRGLFFGRETEVEAMLAKILLNRLVVLFGESGAGKSSLVNAGLAPVLERRRMTIERLRVRPDPAEPFIVERIASGAAAQPFLPSIFVPNDASEAEWPCSMTIFRAAIERACSIDLLAKSPSSATAPWPVLFLDQFEELFTLFGQSPGIAGARELQIQEEIFALIVEIARSETLRVKIVIGIREDFLGRLEILAKRFPAVLDHRVRLSTLDRRGACRAILGPFVAHQYPSRISPHLTRRIVRDLEEQGIGTAIAPTQLQIVCQRLWDVYHANLPVIGLSEYLRLGGVSGIVESFFDSELNAIPQQHRATAIALLGRLVTASGTRDVVSRDKVREGVPSADIDIVLRLLEKRKIINLKSQRNTDYFEVSSEYLIAPIQAVVLDYNRKRELEQLARATTLAAQATAEARYQSRLKKTNWTLIALTIVLALLLFGISLALNQARTQRAVADIKAREALRLKAIADDARSQALSQQTVIADQKTSLEKALTDAQNQKTTADQKTAEALALKDVADRARFLEASQRAQLEGQAQRIQEAVVEANLKETIARAKELCSKALASLTVRPHEALQQALEAVDISPDPGTRSQVANALQQAVQNSRLLSVISAADPQGVTGMTLTPDGKVVALKGSRNLRLIDLATGAALRTFPTQYPMPAFSPNGRLLAIPGLPLDIYDWTTGARMGQSSRFDCLSNALFTANSDGLVCVTHQAKLEILDPQSLQPRILGDVTSSALAFTPDGRASYTLEGVKIVRRSFPEASPVAAGDSDLGTGPGMFIVVSPNGKLVAATDSLRTRLFKSDDLQPVPFDDRNHGLAATPAFSPDGKYLAYSSEQNLFVWNLQSSKLEVTLSWGNSWGTALAFRDNQRLLGLDRDGQVREWDLTSSPNYQALQLPRSSYLPDRNFLSNDGLNAVAMGRLQSQVSSWDVATGRIVASVDVGVPLVLASLNSTGLRMAIGSGASDVQDFDLASGKTLFTFRPVYGPANPPCFLQGLVYRDDGEILALVQRRDTRENHLWAARSNRILATLPSDLDHFWLAPTGALTAASQANGPLHIFQGSAAILDLPGNPSVVAFDRAGRMIAVASAGPSLRVADLSTKTTTNLEKIFQDGSGAVRPGSSVSALAFSPDGTLLAGGNSDRELFVWNLATSKMMYRFGGNDFAIQQLAFTSDGSKITTLAVDGTVRVYWLNLDQLKAHAQKLLKEWPR